MSKKTSFARIKYRVQQVGRALLPTFTREELQWAASFLSAEEHEVFREMAPADRRHCLDVAHICRSMAEQLAPDQRRLLLTAALLHDMGKRQGAIRLGHRIFFVLLGSRRSRIVPFKRWPLVGRPLHVIARHARLGAAEAKKRNWAPDLVALIRHHHDQSGSMSDENRRLLQMLQRADNLC
ncbi:MULTISPECIES: HD domain-containing protein [Heliobacterium]|nr:MULTISPECIES: HD domain-containing protein [Heliobacterium]MBC9785784.1 HD domain-containing protein [Heliobacterium chlorum]